MRKITSVLGASLGLLLLSLGSVATQGQSQRVPSRITEKIDDTRTVQLKGNVHPLARPEFDRGAVDDSQPMTRMLLVLGRSPEQDLALQQLIDAQQTKGSASYHAWLTPDEFGKQFGPSDDDVQTVSAWLARQGFQVKHVATGRAVVEFDGNAGQVRNAFHTEIHKFEVNGQTHLANVSEPAIPEALAPVVHGVVALHNFPRHSYLHNKGSYRWNRDTGEILPLFTYTADNQVTFAMGPGDFNKVYNVPSTATGAGQTIAIVADSNLDANDVIQFRNLFGLPQNFTQANNVLVNGPDPGLNGDEGEADLDVEWAGAIAPQANILLVVSSDTQSNPTQIISGIDLSALYIVDNDPAVNGVPASVLNESFGECEQSIGSTGNIFYNTLWQQAAAEGITVVVSTGDSGSANCDSLPLGSPNAAVNGVAVNGLASTAYNTAVGGTDFDPTATTSTSSTYWNLTVGTVNSALGYIPETTWDDSVCAANFPQACASVDPNGGDLAAGGGGISNCGIWSGSNCSKGYAIPAYQVGVNKISTSYRTIPDVSFFASNGFNGVTVIYCQADVLPQNGNSCSLSSPYTDFNLTGGTSAAAPPFSAIVALVNQATGQRAGNINYGLYSLAANDSNYTSGKCNSSIGSTPATGCVFNDVTKGNNGVACVLGSTSNVDGSTNWCSPGSGGATYGVTVFEGTNTVAYASGAGYDAATGLGSINVNNLLSKWNNANRSATTTTVSGVMTSGNVSGATLTATVTVSPSSSTGNVAITALASDQATILAKIGAQYSSSQGGSQPYTLSGGTVQVKTNLLPPGTAYISASYSGDATHAASTSSPVALSSTVSGNNITPKVVLSLVTFNSSGNPVLSTSGTVTYGSSYILNVVVSNGGQNCGYNYPYTQSPFPCPTGKIALTDNNQPLNDFPSGPNFNATNVAKLSNQGGLVEDGLVQLPGGSHNISAAFTSADANFTNGTSNALPITVNTAATTLAVASSGNDIPSGTQVTLTAVVSSQSNSSQGPTGQVGFTIGNVTLSQAASCVPAGATATVGASCTAQLTTTISSLFPPPTDQPGPKMPLLPLLIAVLSLVLFALGWRWIPQNRRRAYVYAGFLVFALMAVGIAGCGGGGGGGTTTVKVTASYGGDTNYAQSTGTTPITVTH